MLIYLYVSSKRFMFVDNLLNFMSYISDLSFVLRTFLISLLELSSRLVTLAVWILDLPLLKFYSNSGFVILIFFSLSIIEQLNNMDKLVIHMPLIHGIQFYVSHSWNPNETLTHVVVS